MRGKVVIAHKSIRHYVWGALWHSQNEQDGIKEELLYENLIPALFNTRAEVRKYITKKYGYLKNRNDLKRKYGWHMPQPVQVMVMPITPLPRFHRRSQT